MRRVLLWAGPVGAAAFLVGIFAVGSVAPGYNQLSQFVSELGAIGAPTAFYLNVLVLIPAGTLIAVGGLGRCWSGEAVSGALMGLSGVGFTVAGLYRCDASCSFVDMSPAAMIHNQAAFGAFLLAIFSALLLTVSSLFRRDGVRLAVNTCGLVGMITGLAAMMLMGLDHELIGAAQRVFLVSFCLWLILDSIVLLRGRPRPSR